MKKSYIGLMILSSVAFGQVNIYGPGGPAPVLNEITKELNKTENKNIILKFGPAGKWMEEAKQNADIIYSGSEYMMNSFASKLSDLDFSTIKAVKLRESGILVRKENSKNIKSIKDLAKDDVNIIVVDGAGQISLWEDIVGKEQNVELLNKIRNNIKYFAPNSALATKHWKENKNIDAVIIWKPWVKRFENSMYVETTKDTKVMRPASIALTKKGKNNPDAVSVYNDILSSKFDKIWENNGWMK